MVQALIIILISLVTTLKPKSSALDGKRRSRLALVQVNISMKVLTVSSGNAAQLGSLKIKQGEKRQSVTHREAQALTMIIINLATIPKHKSSAPDVTIKFPWVQDLVSTITSWLMGQ